MNERWKHELMIANELMNEWIIYTNIYTRWPLQTKV